MTCEHCHGPVNVSHFNGRMLRCGCGKTSIPNEAFKQPRANDDLAELFALLKQNGVRSFRRGDLEVEFDREPQSLALATADETPPPTEPMPMCKCGHLMPAEHTEAGCVHGCALELCEQSLEKTG